MCPQGSSGLRYNKKYCHLDRSSRGCTVLHHGTKIRLFMLAKNNFILMNNIKLKNVVGKFLEFVKLPYCQKGIVNARDQ
jgi:hypothetical protein